jgi:hypothetical protein
VVCIDENLCDNCCLLVDKGKIVEYESTVVGFDSIEVVSGSIEVVSGSIDIISSDEDVVFAGSEKNFDAEGRVNFGDLVLKDTSEWCNGVDERERRREEDGVVLEMANGDNGSRVEETLTATNNGDEYL